MHLEINGKELYDVRTDPDTWTILLKKTINRKPHPGISTDKKGFETLVKAKAENSQIYVLEEDGKPVQDVAFAENPLFVLGDHVGLPKKAETFVLRYGEKISLGKTPYLAASCITVLNYLLDRESVKPHS